MGDPNYAGFSCLGWTKLRWIQLPRLLGWAKLRWIQLLRPG